MHAFSRLIFGFLTALAGAQLALWLHLPLPWLLGPLLLTAVCSARGWPISGHTLFRNAGQWCIGTSLGLYFTPAMLGVIAVNIPAIAAAVLFALLLGALGAAAYYRFGGVDFQTAWFASAIGGASEMANLAVHYKAHVEQVVSAHSLRVLLVVVIIPFAYQFLGVHGMDDGTAFGKNPYIHGGGLLALLLEAGEGGLEDFGGGLAEAAAALAVEVDRRGVEAQQHGGGFDRAGFVTEVFAGEVDEGEFVVAADFPQELGVEAFCLGLGTLQQLARRGLGEAHQNVVALQFEALAVGRFHLQGGVVVSQDGAGLEGTILFEEQIHGVARLENI